MLHLNKSFASYSTCLSFVRLKGQIPGYKDESLSGLGHSLVSFSSFSSFFCSFVLKVAILLSLTRSVIVEGNKKKPSLAATASDFYFYFFSFFLLFFSQSHILFSKWKDHLYERNKKKRGWTIDYPIQWQVMFSFVLFYSFWIRI